MQEAINNIPGVDDGDEVLGKAPRKYRPITPIREEALYTEELSEGSSARRKSLVPLRSSQKPAIPKLPQLSQLQNDNIVRQSLRTGNLAFHSDPRLVACQNRNYNIVLLASQESSNFNDNTVSGVVRSDRITTEKNFCDSDAQTERN